MKSLYRFLSVLGDAKALSRGPGAWGRRQVRKAGHRAWAKTTRRSRLLRP